MTAEFQFVEFEMTSFTIEGSFVYERAVVKGRNYPVAIDRRSIHSFVRPDFRDNSQTRHRYGSLGRIFRGLMSAQAQIYPLSICRYSFTNGDQLKWSTAKRSFKKNPRSIRPTLNFGFQFNNQPRLIRSY